MIEQIEDTEYKNQIEFPYHFTEKKQVFHDISADRLILDGYAQNLVYFSFLFKKHFNHFHIPMDTA